ncbi:restriction endonuclease [Niveibacterium sp. 24ML]|uniref:restriction endonuclease n=1 Tax=Niveibacterium sp. 24ML TaxID=2985512 RepID=UPI00226EE5D7|nr:restriction endonuclease [Niveibacterium sp. 24ML]MCX9155773.1 restriction endonuclease [Niveibacterium sp. 24ML]
MARYRRKDEGLLTLALQAPWYVSAVFALAIFIGVFVWLPRTTAFGIWGAGMYAGTRPFALIALFVFSAIAIYKFLQQLASQRGGYTYAFEPKARQTSADWGRVASGDARVEPTNQLAPDECADGSARAADARPTEWSLTVLRDMEWKRFEDLCLAFYRAKGIRAESTPLGPDGGVDLRLYQDDADPQRCTAIVQCKAWGERAVGVKLIRELRGVMAHEGVDKGFFMAPGRYTEEARAFAAANRITLIDGRQLLAMLQRLPADVSRKLLAAATAGDWTTPSCPSCGIKMVARESARGAYWGCAAFPKCKQTLGMRECKT